MATPDAPSISHYVNGWCAWCEEAESPTYLRHEGHDPECPFTPGAPPTATPAGGEPDS